MLFSEAAGRKVVSTADASTAGVVDSFVLDPAAGRVVALSLKKTAGAGSLLPWTDITAFGVDAVTIADANLIVEAQGELVELASKNHHILKKRVLTTAGLQVGFVRDVDFDPDDGRVVGILTDDRPIDGQTLIGVGSYAAVVRV